MYKTRALYHTTFVPSIFILYHSCTSCTLHAFMYVIIFHHVLHVPFSCTPFPAMYRPSSMYHVPLMPAHARCYRLDISTFINTASPHQNARHVPSSPVFQRRPNNAPADVDDNDQFIKHKYNARPRHQVMKSIRLHFHRNTCS